MPEIWSVWLVDLHARYWIWIAFQTMCESVSYSAQKGMHLIVSPFRCWESAKKIVWYYIFFGGGGGIQFLLFVWTWPLRDRFRRVEDHQLEKHGSKSKNKAFGDADTEFYYSTGDSGGCQKASCSSKDQSKRYYNCEAVGWDSTQVNHEVRGRWRH